MRGVVRDVLRRISSLGLPGEHHFYISFSTVHPDVKISEQLRSKYPKEITIVLQHQFWDFKVEELGRDELGDGYGPAGHGHRSHLPACCGGGGWRRHNSCSGDREAGQDPFHGRILAPPVTG
jgi:hypothetical protein